MNFSKLLKGGLSVTFFLSDFQISVSVVDTNILIYYGTLMGQLETKNSNEPV